MPRRFIDLSVAIDSTTPADPPPMRPEIKYQAHDETAPAIAAMFPGFAGRQRVGRRGFETDIA
jgi:hypothetical protein